MDAITDIIDHPLKTPPPPASPSNNLTPPPNRLASPSNNLTNAPNTAQQPPRTVHNAEARIDQLEQIHVANPNPKVGKKEQKTYVIQIPKEDKPGEFELVEMRKKKGKAISNNGNRREMEQLEEGQLQGSRWTRIKRSFGSFFGKKNKKRSSPRFSTLIGTDYEWNTGIFGGFLCLIGGWLTGIVGSEPSTGHKWSVTTLTHIFDTGFWVFIMGVVVVYGGKYVGWYFSTKLSCRKGEKLTILLEMIGILMWIHRVPGLADVENQGKKRANTSMLVNHVVVNETVDEI